jgi:hypothetical protein
VALTLGGGGGWPQLQPPSAYSSLRALDLNPPPAYSSLRALNLNPEPWDRGTGGQAGGGKRQRETDGREWGGRREGGRQGAKSVS